MIIDIWQIFRARKNPHLASKLALRFAQNQAIDRITAPLFLVHVVLWAVGLVCAVLVISALLGAISLHWTVILPAIVPAAIGSGTIYLSLSLMKGLELIKTRIANLSDRGIDRLAGSSDDIIEQDLAIEPQATPKPAPKDI